MISVALADDQGLVRMGLRQLFEGEEGFRVAGEAADGLAAVATAKATRPDVVLIDIRMPGIDGLEATRRITADPMLAQVRVIVLTTFEREDYIFAALRNGASGYLLKDMPPHALLEAVSAVVAGGALLTPSVTRTLIREFVDTCPRQTTPHPNLAYLTHREREIVPYVADGLSNHEIGEELVISVATVRTHVSRTMIKLGARDRAQLVAFAYQSGLA